MGHGSVQARCFPHIFVTNSVNIFWNISKMVFYALMKTVPGFIIDFKLFPRKYLLFIVKAQIWLTWQRDDPWRCLSINGAPIDITKNDKCVHNRLKFATNLMNRTRMNHLKQKSIFYDVSLRRYWLNHYHAESVCQCNRHHTPEERPNYPL